MFSFFKRKKETENTEEEILPAEAATPEEVSAASEIEQPVVDAVETVAEADEQPAPSAPVKAVATPEPEPAIEKAIVEILPARKPGFFKRMRQGLSRTRSGLSDGLSDLLLGKKEIDEDLLEELETQLLMADVGVETTSKIMATLNEKIGRNEVSDSDALYKVLVNELQSILKKVERPLETNTGQIPFIILMVGINGVGKTTTIGKLAKQYQAKGKKVMLAAGDTFRAAAVEQLQVWGERNNVPVIAQHTGADSASVLYDAVQAAKNRGIDILIADTAGRLHTKDNLMQELEKVIRVIKKHDYSAPHEVMLVLDAGTGQNAINQLKHFKESVGVTGLTLSKLDGTAKGGVIFALAQQFGVPVRFIGIGEGVDDLRTFNAEEFTKALFQKEEEN